MNVSSVTELEVMGIVPDDRFHTCAESVDFNCDIDTMQHMLNSSVSQFIVSEAITTQNKQLAVFINIYHSRLLPKKLVQCDSVENHCFGTCFC